MSADSSRWRLAISMQWIYFAFQWPSIFSALLIILSLKYFLHRLSIKRANKQQIIHSYILFSRSCKTWCDDMIYCRRAFYKNNITDNLILHECDWNGYSTRIVFINSIFRHFFGISIIKWFIMCLLQSVRRLYTKTDKVGVLPTICVAKYLCFDMKKERIKYQILLA